jgi:hypothetical protein
MSEEIAKKEDTAIGMTKSIGMVCNSCMVSANCPKFQVDSVCTIDFNAVFTKLGKSTEAIKESALDIIALQNERVHRAAHQERLNFGTLDPNLSAEISRYFELLGNYKKLGEKKDKINIEAEGTQSLGILSKLLQGVNKTG